MKVIDPTLDAYLKGTPGRYAKLYTLILRDASTYLFTNYQKNIIIPGVSPLEFKSSNAIDDSAIESTTGGIAQNAELKISYTDNLTRDQMLSGLMDNATFMIELVDWLHPEAGTVVLMLGTLQRKSVNDVRFGTWSVKGQLGELDGNLGEIYSQECRAVLGDARCTVDLEDYTETFTVSTVISPHNYTRFTCIASGARPAGFFNLGFATFGVLGTERFEILSDSGGSPRTIILAVPRTQEIEFGDEGTLVAGCNKTHSDCLNKFNNILNMRAEPFKPIGSLQVQT